MRTYAQICPTFWIGKTGRQLRESGACAQVMALYLLTCPSSNHIGLYYLPLQVLHLETGFTPKTAKTSLDTLKKFGFSFFDAQEEMIWVPEMARYQIGESLKSKDNRHKNVVDEIKKYRKSRFLPEFMKKYGKSYNLEFPDIEEKPLTSPLEGSTIGVLEHREEIDIEQKEIVIEGASPKQNQKPPSTGPEILVVEARDYINKHPLLPLWNQRMQDDLVELIKRKPWSYVEKCIDNAISERSKNPVGDVLKRVMEMAGEKPKAADRPKSTGLKVVPS